MRLERNISRDSKGKFAVINLRKNTVEWGEPNTREEFFVIKLKDKYARVALEAYAAAAKFDDPEYAKDVAELAARSGDKNPFCKRPD